MQNPKGLKLLFIINPVSGGRQKNDWEASIRDFFRERPEHIEFFLMSGKDDTVSIKHHIETIQPDRVVAVGGDGTVKMLATLLKETGLPLGILPAGSANGMAKELQIPLEVEEALKVILDGACRQLDLIRINEEHICIHLSDFGLNAMLVKYFEQSKGRGMWGYGKAAFRVLLQKQMMHINIRMDAGEIRRKAFMLVIANAQTYGTGAIINPDGEIDDGIFEVIVVRKLNVLELFKMLVSHKPFHPDRIEVFHTRNLELNLKRRAYLQVDGEYLGRQANLTARIMPRVLHVMLPPSRMG
jgi:YegS/Rv2252/BmrU family lipid kinase